MGVQFVHALKAFIFPSNQATAIDGLKYFYVSACGTTLTICYLVTYLQKLPLHLHSAPMASACAVQPAATLAFSVFSL